MTPSTDRFAALSLGLLLLTAPAAYGEDADRNQPIQLESDRVVVDDARQVSTFSGKVKLSQGSLRITAEQIIITQAKDGFSTASASGQLASFRQKRQGTDEYVEGYAERIDYDTRNETIDLYKQARVKRAQDEVRGEHITYSTKTEIFQVHGAIRGESGSTGQGRVRAVIQPRNKEAAP